MCIHEHTTECPCMAGLLLRWKPPSDLLKSGLHNWVKRERPVKRMLIVSLPRLASLFLGKRFCPEFGLRLLKYQKYDTTQQVHYPFRLPYQNLMENLFLLLTMHVIDMWKISQVDSTSNSSDAVSSRWHFWVRAVQTRTRFSCSHCQSRGTQHAA